MYTFTYKKPASLDEAAQLLAADAKALAGGMTLLPTIKQRLASPATLVDLSALDELRGIERTDGGISIGAMTRHCEVAQSKDVAAAIPALAALAGGIGDAQVRHRGTIGGSVANNDPAADYPAALLALDAVVVTTKREIGAADYFTGLFETALEDGELITQVRFAAPDKAAYVKLLQPASLYALVGVFVAQTGSGVRVAVTGAGADGVFLHKELGDALGGDFSAGAARQVKVSADGLISDLHGSAEYRASLIGVAASRAVAAC